MPTPLTDYGSSITHGDFVVLRALAGAGDLGADGPVPAEALATTSGATAVDSALARLESVGLVAGESRSEWSVTADGVRALAEACRAYDDLFSSLTPVRLVGYVTSGLGTGGEFVRLDGYATQFRERLGYEPFAGTLNVDLDAASVRRRSAVAALDPIRIDPWADGDAAFGGASCYPVAFPDRDRRRPVHLVVPDQTDHDERQLELLAPDRLRDAGLDDGDELVVEVGDAGDA